jgi:hypothetical protein
MVRSAGELWALHDLLQPVCSLTDGWHLGLAHGGPRGNPRRLRPDDRHIYCPRTSARRLRGWGRNKVDGPVERWADDQNTRLRRYQRNAGATCFLIYNQARCCWLIEGTTQTGLEHSPVTEVRGLTFLRSKIAKIQSLLAHICIVHATCVERFFNKIKQCRRIATRCDKLAANYLAFVKLAAIRIWLRAHESTP